MNWFFLLFLALAHLINGSEGARLNVPETSTKSMRYPLPSIKDHTTLLCQNLQQNIYEACKPKDHWMNIISIS